MASSKRCQCSSILGLKSEFMETPNQPHSEQRRAADATPDVAPPVSVDLLTKCADASHSGPQWAHESEDLDVTLLSWGEGRSIEAHVNSEVDVVLISIEGEGVVTIEGVAHELRPGQLLLIPKGSARSMESTSPRFSYLSLHRRRSGLMPVPYWKGSQNEEATES